MAENASLKVACIQMTSGPDIDENLKTAEALIREASAEGAKFIVTPENTCHIRFPAAQKLISAPREKDHPAIPFFAALAHELKVHILIGSLSIQSDEGGKLYNRSYLFDAAGNVAAKYDKIHLFDVSLPTGEKHRESDIILPGDRLVTSQISDDFTVGLSICYDVRFAYLYRSLAKAGANVLCVPAAFTVPTGKSHWEVLLRARAIETGSYVIACGQVGEHEGGRKTYGHSMIISPWGEIIACKDDGVGVLYADIDIAAVERARGAIPVLTHDRDYYGGGAV